MLRPIAPTDLDRIYEINQANVPEVGDATVEHLEHLVAQSAIALVSTVDDAEQGEQITGFCIVFGPDADYDSLNYLWFMDRHPDSMYLDRVAFDASYQGGGRGSAMYAEVDRRIRQDHRSATGLSLEVNIEPPNEPSLAFHRKHGFVEVGQRVSHDITVSLMHRPL